MGDQSRLATLALLSAVLTAMSGSVQGQDCDTTISSPTTSFASARIKSPNYPADLYKSNLNCVTSIRSNVTTNILVRFRAFRLQGRSGACTSDTLKIYPVTGEPPSLVRAAEPVRVLCGALKPDEMDFSWKGLGLDIVFDTDYRFVNLGYEAAVFITPSDLVASLTANAREVSTNSFVTLECRGHNFVNASATVTIANITWTRDNTIMENIHDSVIKVTSVIAADVTFGCFVTDIYGQDSLADDIIVGFKEGPVCNTEIKTAWATITSPGFPGFPGFYDHNLLCVTKLRSDVTSRFLVRFRSFSVELSEGCMKYDYVHIYTVTGEPSSLVRAASPSRALCGRSLQPDQKEFSWEGLGLDIVFRSDSSVALEGFEADVFISPLDPDALTISLTASTFESTVNSIVTLECQALDPSNPDATIIPIANITWTRDNTTMEDIHDSVINVTSEVAADVTFSCFVTGVNGSNGTQDVVIAFYEVVDDCDTTIRTPSARLTSPRFPRLYPNNAVCVTRLRSNFTSTHLVRFLNFTLEDSAGCGWDYVKIYPVTGEPNSLERAAEPLRVLCGSLEPDEMEVSWEGLGLDIVFSSDASIRKAGFEAEVLITPLEYAMDLTLKRDTIFPGDDDHFGALICEANGTNVNVESVTLRSIKATGESTDLLTVTVNTSGNTFNLNGMLGNGTLENNSGYIFMDQAEAAACDSSFFICEATYTTLPGERKRAIAITRPGQPTQVNRTEDLAVAQEKLSDLSAVFVMLNGSYTSLLEEQQEVEAANANFSARISELENKLSSTNDQSCGPCSNITAYVEDLQRKLGILENSQVQP